MKIQLDTNIVIDILEEREPHVQFSEKLLNEALKQNHKLLVTANSVDNIAYVLRKKISAVRLAEGLERFFKWVDITPVHRAIIMKALQARWADLEDAIQYFSAMEAKTDMIVTRDQGGYQEHEIKILNPKEALKLLNGE